MELSHRSSRKVRATWRSAASTSYACVLIALWACGDEEATAKVASEPALVSATGVFTSTSGELAIAVSPQDSAGNFVGQGLPQSAFSFRNVRMSPATASTTKADDITLRVTGRELDAPDPDAELDAVVVFDSSGSMSGNDPGAVGRLAGGQALFEVLRDGDQLAVLDFGAGVTKPLTNSRLLQDFTADQTLLQAALEKLTESGGTPLYESILDGLTLLSAREAEISALVVLTDGQATGGAILDKAIAAAQKGKVPVYAIGLGKSLDYGDLARIGEETHGGFVEASDAMALERAFAGVSSGLRVGSVLVRGAGTFNLTSKASRYRIDGELVTKAANDTFVTEFSFTTDLTKATDAGAP